MFFPVDETTRRRARTPHELAMVNLLMINLLMLVVLLAGSFVQKGSALADYKLVGVLIPLAISLAIFNRDAHSKSYDHLKDIFRPGHGDYSYLKKYGLRDHRGGGRSSARETAARVAAGAVARKLLA